MSPTRSSSSLPHPQASERYKTLTLTFFPQLKRPLYIYIFDCNVQHLAYEYAMKGACLALVARRESSLRDVAERARDFGSPDVIVIQADVSKVDDCKRLVSDTMNHFGRRKCGHIYRDYVKFYYCSRATQK